MRAVDPAGNVGDPVSVTWTLLGPPETILDSGPAAVTGDTTATFTFSADVPGSTFTCSLDGGAFLPCASPAEFFDLGGGAHTLSVVATSPAGFADETPAEYAWVVEAPADTTPPAATITSGPAAVTLATAATFAFTANEVGATFQCSLDVGSFATCTAPHTVDGLAEGEHTIAVRAVDAAGNVGLAVGYTWTVDGPPETVIGSGPDGQTEATTATFEFTADEAGSTYTCWLDGAEAPCVSPVTYTGLAVGEHVFASGDGCRGNQQPDWVDYEWIVVAVVPPETTITAGPTGTTTDAAATFSFAASETSSSNAPSMRRPSPPAARRSPTRRWASARTPSRCAPSTPRRRSIQTPATTTWTIAAPAPTCTATTLTLTASADSWIRREPRRRTREPTRTSKVTSKSGGNTRTLVTIPDRNHPRRMRGRVGDAPRLWLDSYRNGRTLQALPVSGTWSERV